MPSPLRPVSPRARPLAPLFPVVFAALLIAYALGAMSSVPAPALASGSPWTFPQLVQQIDARTVVSVVPATQTVSGSATAAGAPGGSGASYTAVPSSSVVAAARTTDGRIVPIDSPAGPGAVIDALRLLGRAAIISPEAAQRWPADGTGIDPAGLLPVLAIALAVLFVAFVTGFTIARRRHGSSPGRRVMHGKEAGAAAATAAGAPAPNPVRFADVAGVEEAKVELAETVEFLREPARFRALGAKPVRGVLLSGPPGTGKTLLAKAVAHEAGVPFFAVSGSEFVERYVGVGAERVRSLFAKAREAGRGVVFIDEIDAVAKVRGGHNSHDEREQTLNQLLVEMDGFATGDTVVVMGATNRVDTLDPALLRPGRFTRKIHVPLPDREAREAILHVHAADKPLEAGVDLAAMARRTYGFSGAMLADLLNEAAIFAARGHRTHVTSHDVQAGWLKVAVGTARQRSMDERERSIIAAHESGHAICSVLAGDGRRVEEISLFQHGEALGVTVSSGDDDALPSEVRLRARLVALMGGRAAEELVFAEVTGGASNDFEQATRLATQMVTRWGLGRDPDATDPGPTGRGLLSAFVVTGQETPLPAELVAAQARAIRELLDEAYAAARDLLRSERDRLDRVAAYLFENERMSGDELDALLDGSLAAAGTERWRALSRVTAGEELAVAAGGTAAVFVRRPARPQRRSLAPGGAGPAVAAAAVGGGAAQPHAALDVAAIGAPVAASAPGATAGVRRLLGRPFRRPRPPFRRGIPSPVRGPAMAVLRLAGRIPRRLTARGAGSRPGTATAGSPAACSEDGD